MLWREQTSLADQIPSLSGYREFGYAVAIDGDYALASVGFSDATGNWIWDVTIGYVYKRIGERWVLQDRLVMKNYAVRYGTQIDTVDIYSDRAIVGALGYYFIFKRTGSTWEQEKVIDHNEFDDFSGTVALNSTSAFMGTRKGSVYIFNRTNMGWSRSQTLTTGNSFDFSKSIAVGGGYLVAGAPRTPSTSDQAVIFKYNGTTWSELSRLTAADAAPGDNFGSSVGISGDFVRSCPQLSCTFWRYFIVPFTMKTSALDYNIFYFFIRNFFPLRVLI